MLLRPIAALAVLLCSSANIFGAGERIDLSAGDEAGRLSHVSIQIEVGGHNLVRPEQVQSSDKSATGEQSLPISVAGKLSYDEKRLANDSSNAGANLAVRYYDEAEATIKVGETGRAPRLPGAHRVLVRNPAGRRPGARPPAQRPRRKVV